MFDSLKQMVEYSFDYGKTIIEKEKTQPAPMFVVEDSDGNLTMHLSQFESDYDKEMLAYTIRFFGVAHNAKRIVFISEVWMARLAGDTPRDELPNNLENYQGRESALLVVGESLVEGEEGLRMVGTIIDDTREIVNIQSPEYEHSEGRMTNFLLAGEKTDELRKQAEELWELTSLRVNKYIVYGIVKDDGALHQGATLH